MTVVYLESMSLVTVQGSVMTEHRQKLGGLGRPPKLSLAPSLVWGSGELECLACIKAVSQQIAAAC